MACQSSIHIISPALDPEPARLRSCSNDWQVRLTGGHWHCSVNDSEYGLQAGVFTHDLDKAWHAFEKLDVGGVVVGHVPSIRVDAQVRLTPCSTICQVR